MSINEDYEFSLHLLTSSMELGQLEDHNYQRIYEMFMDSDGECLERLKLILYELLDALADHKRQRISERLVIGAEKIEAAEDPKEKARLMMHYNNLVQELTA